MSLFTLVNTVRNKGKRGRELTFQLSKRNHGHCWVTTHLVSQHSPSRKHSDRDDDDDDEGNDTSRIIVAVFLKCQILKVQTFLYILSFWKTSGDQRGIL